MVGREYSGELCAELITDKALSAYTHSEVRTILDPEAFVASRISLGGTSVVARETLATSALADLSDMKKKLQLRADHVGKGLKQLLEDAHSITSSS